MEYHAPMLEYVLVHMIVRSQNVLVHTEYDMFWNCKCRALQHGVKCEINSKNPTPTNY